MALKSVELRLERLIEGTVGRLFSGGVRPIEISRKIGRAMADSRSVGVKGQPVVANHFVVSLSATDLERFAEIRDTLVSDLSEAARETAKEEGWTFMGPVEIVLEEGPGLRAGTVRVGARMKEADGATGVLHLPNGQQLVLGEFLLTMGRLPECTVSFDDPNISRVHAEIRPDGKGFVLNDVGSTNGTTVNGVRISSHRLVDGDRITIGATDIEFRSG